jgi:autotransporter-associated beta strand protein
MAVAGARADEVRVLVMGSGQIGFEYGGFPAGRLTDHLRSLLEGSGQYSNVLVTYHNVALDSQFSTSLLGAYYVPTFRAQHLAMVQSTNWTHVVMIDRPFYYAAAPELHYVGVNAWAKFISRAGAQPVLMMAWVDRATMDFTSAPVNNTQVREYAYRVGDGARDHLGNPVPVVPAGVAWSTLPATNRGTLATQPGTGVALNTNGEYTAAASLFTYLTGENAKSVSYLPPGMTTTNRDAIADHVVAVLSNEANAVRYTGAFENPRMKLWAGTTNLHYSEEGTSTEVAIADQLQGIGEADGFPTFNTTGTYATNTGVNIRRSNLVFARYNFLYPNTVTKYDTNIPPSTMLASFDRQGDDVTTGLAGAQQAESQLYDHYYYAMDRGYTVIPYHLLWVRTLYDLGIPIDNFNVHAPDWQFAATASALYTLRTGGRNGVHPSVAGRTTWSAQTRTERFAWRTMQMAWETMMEMATLAPAPTNRVRALGFDRIIDAEAFHEASGPMTLATNPLETLHLAQLQDGDWTGYDIDFGTPAPHALAFVGRLACNTAGAQIEIRHQSPTGTLFGTVSVPSTGGANTFWETRRLLTCNGLTGTQLVVFVYRVPGGTQLALDHFRLTLLARDGDSAWLNVGGGPWSTATNWSIGTPDGTGVTATFSIDLPGANVATIPVSYSGTSTLGRLVFGHGIGTNGGAVVSGSDADRLILNNGGSPAEIRKPAGGADVLAVPILNTNDLRINNRSTATLSLLRTISGGGALYPFGRVRFEGANYDVGRVGHNNGFGTEDLAFPNTVVDWFATGTIRNLSMPINTTWNLHGAITNLGWTDIGNDNSGTTASGTFNINGGVLHHATTNFFRLGNSINCTTVINLNGGMIDTMVGFTQRAATLTINLDGGTLRYSGSTDLTNWIAKPAGRPLTVRVGGNGARFDIVAGRTVALPHGLSSTNADAGIEKLGGGTFVLAASNSFRGPVAVRAGTLRATSPFGFGAARQFDVPAGSILDIPGPQTLVLSGTNAGWTGAGTLRGHLAATQAVFDVTEGPLAVTGSVALASPSVRWLPRTTAGAVHAQGVLTLSGTLTLNALAPTQAIAAGASIPLFTGASRIGTFGVVTGSTLWTAGYTASGMTLTANANIPGISFAQPNGGSPVNWGQSVLFSVDVDDAAGIASVEFFSGDTKLGDGVEGPAGVYTFNWHTGAEPAQTHAIRVRVTNLDGVVLESSPQALVVNALTGTKAVWTELAGGAWSVATNWRAGVIADGYSPAHFDELDIPSGSTTVQVDSARTVSKLRFADTAAGTPGSWKVTGSALHPITLSGGAPEIEIASSTTDVAAALSAPQGFTKLGAGLLELSASNVVSNTVFISAGALSIRHDQALGNGSVLLGGGSLAMVNEAVVVPNALVMGNTTQSLVDLTRFSRLTGPISTGASPTNAVFHLRNNNTNESYVAGPIQLSGRDLLVTTASSNLWFSGPLTARNFRVTGSGFANIVLSSNMQATVEQLATLNDSQTATILLRDNAQFTAPSVTFTLRSGFAIHGGILTVGSHVLGSSASMTCNGGVVRPTQSSTNWIRKTTPTNANSTLRNLTRGFVVDTVGYDVTVEPSLVTASNPDGGITKRGAGVLTLSGFTPVPSWRGTTTVENGTLKISPESRMSTNTRSFVIESGATLDIADSTTTPTLVMNNSAFRLAGGGTLRGGVTLTDGRMALTAGQPLTVTGNVLLGPSGTRILDISGTLPGPGAYPLLHAASITGTFNSVLGMPSAPTGFTAQLVYETTQVLIRVAGPGEAWLSTNAAPGAKFGEDPDTNGWTYLEEYAFGIPPGGTGKDQRAPGLSPSNTLHLAFTYNTTAIDASIDVLAGTNLFQWTPIFSKPAGSATNWTPLVPGAVLQQGPITGTYQTVTVRGPGTNEVNSFIMLDVRRLE